MELGSKPQVELPRERPIRLLAALPANDEVMVDRPPHRGFERLDRVPLEVDLVPEIDDVAREQPKLRVEINYAGV